MAAPSVNTRKLKDSVAEYLKKNKLDKACETLEQLVKAEPKDMTHRLKLGDTYRRLGDAAKAIGSYQSAAKFFSDEGLLIKAIAAIKIILEIDPQNQMAQRELGEMNQRRFAKPTLESAGLRPPPSSPPIGREAAEPEPQPAGSARPKDGRGLPQASERGLDLQLGDDDEPLELDDGRSFTPSTDKIKPRSGAASAPSLPRPPGPAPKQRGAFDLGAGADPIDLESLPEAELAEAELEELPSEAIVEERKRDQAAAKPSKPALAAAAPLAARSPARPPPPPSQLDDEDEPLEMGRRAPAARAPASAPPLPPARPASAGRAVPSSGPARPIADLLISDTDEIELLSVSSDRDLPAVSDLPPEPARPATVAPLARKIAADDMDADVDQAFGALSPAASGQPSRPAPPRVALFDDLPQEAFVDLVNRLSYLRFSPPELIIREGDPGRSFFVIVEGKVRVFKAQKGGDEITLAHLSEGAFFGEMALLSGAPRTANVAAEEDTELLEVTDAVLREVVQKYPTVAVSLKKFYRQRLLNNVMAISPLFKDFVPAERKAIVDRFRMRQFAQGEVLITEGTPSDGLYVVLHGAVNVETRAPNNQRVALARLKEGEVFGEMSLLTRKNATATVTALTNSIVLKLPREHFQELVLTHPQILELVSVLTEQRKNATDAILQGQGPGVDGMAFV